MIPVLFAFWWILNGAMTAELLVIGLVICAALRLFAWKFLGLTLRRELAAVRRVPALLGYVCWLVGEIARAAAKTIRLIWSPTQVCEPRLVAFRVRLRTRAGKAMLANSITLTPGTITVDIREDWLLAHCLDAEFGEGLEDSEMERRIRAIEEGGGPDA